jgi:hypothetical protein
MDWRIKYVGSKEWKFLPEEERKRKQEYERLVIKIERREKKIEKTLIQLKKDKKDLRDWKKDRTKLYSEVVKYHKKFSPTFSFVLHEGEKASLNPSGDIVETSGNNQFGMWVSVGRKRKYIYIGTIDKVGFHLDLIENNTNNIPKGTKFSDLEYRERGYYERLSPTKNEKHKKEIISKLEFYLCEVIVDKMLRSMNKYGSLETFFTKQIKLNGNEMLYSIYKKTPHYQPQQEPKKKKKGGRLKPIRVGKNKLDF